jgi:uncharacterized repeat protein (TIGR03803 family)
LHNARQLTPHGGEKSQRETVVHIFQGASDGAKATGGLIDLNGTLYGVTEEGGGSRNGGTIYAVTVPSGNERVLYSFQGGSDGAQPSGNLVDLNGVFYGTTFFGGEGGCGTVFAFDPSLGEERVLYPF